MSEMDDLELSRRMTELELQVAAMWVKYVRFCDNVMTRLENLEQKDEKSRDDTVCVGRIQRLGTYSRALSESEIEGRYRKYIEEDDK